MEIKWELFKDGAAYKGSLVTTYCGEDKNHPAWKITLRELIKALEDALARAK